jgi:ABC-type sugar transport system substrate-binding protein
LISLSISARTTKRREPKARTIWSARSAGKDKIIVIGVDGNTNAVKSIKAGRLNASVAQLPYLVGMQAVEDVKKVLAGDKVPEMTYVPTLVLTKEVIEANKEPMLQYVK